MAEPIGLPEGLAGLGDKAGRTYFQRRHFFSTLKALPLSPRGPFQGPYMDILAKVAGEGEQNKKHRMNPTEEFSVQRK